MTPLSLSSPSTATLSPTMMSDDPALLRGKNAVELGQQFEGLFVSMLVKEMRQSSAGEDGLFPGDSSDTYGGLFDMYMGQHIAENGGIGLSESIAAAIEKQNQSN